MKRNKKSIWLTMLSLIVLSIFVFMGALTWGDATPKPVIDYNPTTGIATESIIYPRSGESEITKGKWDPKNKIFVGQVTISYTAKNTDPLGSEVVNMKDGERHGKAIYTHYPDNRKESICYQNGERVDETLCEGASEKSAVFSSNDNSAYSIFSYEVPWYAFKLSAFGYSPDYVQSYMDTLELLLYSYEFAEDEFEDYYEEVIEVLEETPYDSIIQLNAVFSFYNGLDLITGNEFRLATIYSYREGDGNTYEVVKSIYPNYLLQLNSFEVTDTDFEGFCGEYDSIMTTYVPIAPEDVFFVDSMEERMYRTLDLMVAEDEESASESLSLKSARAFKPSDYSPAEVAEVVFFLIIFDFINGDLIKDAVAEAFAQNNGIVQLPTVVTDLSGNSSSTSAEVYGHVIEDGGGEVSSRGIAWASFYNPTLDNQVITAGSGTGEFEETISGLSEGETYYARAYATNSAGTAYGNCIAFVAQNTTGLDALGERAGEFSIYPNPASENITLSFNAQDSKPMAFTMYDMSGKVVIQKELASLVQGENVITVNLSEIDSGSYLCRLEGDDFIHSAQILVVSR